MIFLQQLEKGGFGKKYIYEYGQMHKITKIQSYMSRTVPWRNKPTTLITQMIPVASEMKMYLVNEIGPTSFLFKDENQNKFKVNIGLKISCSCGIVVDDHCIHTLYVMLKKYRVPENHPIIWQASYLDSQLEGLIQLKYREKKKTQVKSTFKARKKNIDTMDDGDDDFPPLEQDAACPICYEQMEGQCYSTCTVCHKSIHSKCLKVWARHKLDNGAKVTCPMCRSQFHNPMGMVMRDLERWQKRFTVHKGSTCKGCGVKNIKGLIYKCLLCPNTDLCKLCYEGNQHLDHDRFFVKELSTQPWHIAPIRVKKSRKQLFDLIKEVNTRDLPTQINSTEFVVSLFPTLKEYQGHQNANDLGIVGNQILSKQFCHKCRNSGDQNMKRLNCGHCVHATCVAAMFQMKQYRCEIDQEPMCPGYLSAMGIKVPAKKSKGSDVAFIKADEESRKINNKLGENMFGLGQKAQRLNERTKQHPSANKFGLKTKDRNFRIMKKQIMDRKMEVQSLGVGVGFGPMMVTGLSNQQPSMMQPPLMPQPANNNRASRNRTTPKFK